MACRGAGCAWKRSYHASRIEEHLIVCDAAKSKYPEMMCALGRDPGGSPLVPGLAPTWLPETQLLFVEALLRSAMPFGAFYSPAWRAVLSRVSQGTFEGPGTRQAIGGWILDAVAAKYLSAAIVRILVSSSFTLSIDGWTDLRSRELYNFMVCLPLSLFVSTFSLGVAAATADALLARLTVEITALNAALDGARAAHQPPAADSAGPDEVLLGEAATTYPRLRQLASRSVWGLVTDSPNVMVRVRRLARAAGLATVTIGCADHAINLVTRDCANVEPFSGALCDGTRVAVFMRRCGRARAAMAGALADLRALGRGVADVVTFSESRWCGIHLTVESVRRCLPVLQTIIGANQLAQDGFDVPPAVEGCIMHPAFGQGLAAASPFLGHLLDCSRFVEADAAPLSSFVASFTFLWLLLDGVRVTGLPTATRTYLRDRLSARFKRAVDCHVALAFFLDPFWAQLWGRAGTVGLGGKTILQWREKSLEELAGEDAALRASLSRELQSFLCAHRPAAEPKPDECLHPVGYWQLHGDAYPCLHVIAERLLAVCPTSAGGERCFKRVSAVMSRNRSGMAVGKATKKAQILYNGGQLERSDVIDSFCRSAQKRKMRRAMVGGNPLPGAAGSPVAPELVVHVFDAEDVVGGDDPPPPDLEAEEVAGVVDALFAVHNLETDDEL